MSSSDAPQTCTAHTEHALRGGPDGDGMVGRSFPNWKIGGAGVWERCEIETARFYGPHYQPRRQDTRTPDTP